MDETLKRVERGIDISRAADGHSDACGWSGYDGGQDGPESGFWSLTAWFYKSKTAKVKGGCVLGASAGS